MKAGVRIKTSYMIIILLLIATPSANVKENFTIDYIMSIKLL